MSPLPIFFRLAHSDGPVLVRVAPRSSTKSRPLDLELRATDDVRAFVLPLQHSKISRYRSEGSSLSDEEWESCLTSLLLGTGPIGHLDVTAKFADDNLEIEIGKRVSGATDIAGTLVLRPSKSATKNADMFAWASEAVLRQAELAEELAELKLKHDFLQERVDQETARFEALEHSKNEFESEHNSFFRDLLNEKKTQNSHAGADLIHRTRRRGEACSSQGQGEVWQIGSRLKTFGCRCFIQKGQTEG